MICTNCGRQIKDGTRFCAYCGAAQAQSPAAWQMQQPAGDNAAQQANMYYAPQPSPAPAAQPRKKSKLPLVLGAAAVVLAAGVGAAGYFVMLPKLTWQNSMKEAAEYLSEEDFDSALDALDKAEKARPGQLETAVQYARAYARSGKLEKARKYLQQVTDATVEQYPKTDEQDEETGMSDSQKRTLSAELPKEYEHKETGTSDSLEMGWAYCKWENNEKTEEDHVTVFYDNKQNADSWCRTWWVCYADRSYVSEVNVCDQNGNITETTTYNEDGSRDSVEQITYDENGKEIKSVLTSDDGICQTNEWENEKLHRFTYTEADGFVSYQTETICDEAGNIKSETVWDYDTDRKLSKREETYDEHGNILTWIYYNENGEKISDYQYYYTYDENGNKVTEEYRNGKLILYSENTYEEDGTRTETIYYRGELSEECIYKPDGSRTEKSYWKGELSYEDRYDENGDRTEYISYEDGNVRIRQSKNRNNGYLLTSKEENMEENAITQTYYYYISNDLMQATMLD